MMKNIGFLFLLNISILFSDGQNSIPNEHQRTSIVSLIDQYAEAREKRDTVLLKAILTSDVDQLVSTGEWRNRIGASVEGMMKSSTNSPGKRTLNIEKIRMVTTNSALVDCKYDIQNKDGTTRKMWSMFVVVFDKGIWKISAIRNMLPTTQ